jgi:hypothetical protein
VGQVNVFFIFNAVENLLGRRGEITAPSSSSSSWFVAAGRKGKMDGVGWSVVALLLE